MSTFTPLFFPVFESDENSDIEMTPKYFTYMILKYKCELAEIENSPFTDHKQLYFVHQKGSNKTSSEILSRQYED